MRRPYKAAIVGGGLGKAVTIDDFDNFLDYLVNQGEGSSPQDLYKVVAWVYWCVNQRAGNIAQIPYLVFPIELPEDEESKDAAAEWGIDLRLSIWHIEAWLRLKGAAYVLKIFEGQTLVDLQVLNAYTMQVKTWDARGKPITFEQQIGQTRQIFQADEIIYFRLFNPSDDIREGTPSSQPARSPSTLIKNTNQWGEAFFENGAIPAVLLTTEGTVPPGEKERIQGLWNKVLKGVQRAFGTVVMERGLTPTIIGQDVVDLAMPELEKAKKEQILAAYDLPPGMAEPRMGLADRRSMMEALWIQHLIPSTEIWIEPVFNDQLFNALGLRLSFQYKELEAIQRIQLEQSESSAFLVNIIASAYEDNAASLDEYRSWVDQIGQWARMPPLDPNFTPEERTPPQLQPFTGEQDAGDNGGGEDEPTPIDERIESRLPKAAGSERPKASAPPRWGQYRIGPTASLRNSDDGETKPPSAPG